MAWRSCPQFQWLGHIIILFVFQCHFKLNTELFFQASSESEQTFTYLLDIHSCKPQLIESKSSRLMHINASNNVYLPNTLSLTMNKNNPLKDMNAYKANYHEYNTFCWIFKSLFNIVSKWAWNGWKFWGTFMHFLALGHLEPKWQNLSCLLGEKKGWI